MPLLNKTGKSKGFTFTVIPEKVYTPGSAETGCQKFTWQKTINKKGNFNQEKGSRAKQET